MTLLSLSSAIRKSNYWSRMTGVRWNLLLSIVIFWLAGWWLQKEYGGEQTNLWLVMNLFIRLTQWTIIVLFAISLLTALITWSYFLITLKRKSVTVRAKLGDGQKAEAGVVPFSVSVEGPVIRPFLGSVQAALIFSEQRMSDVAILDTAIPKPKSFFRKGIGGSGNTMLHDRGIYDIEEVVIYFCDMLGLLALPTKVPYVRQLFTLPRSQPEQQVKAQPNAVEEQKHRIEIPRRVQGEYVNYKEFETGDNIRRIVWKIYAKSGQLVVRIPETKDPYASHLYFYPSFFHGLEFNEGVFEKELLNVYKDDLRTLYEAVQRNGYDVRLPADQEIPRLHGVDEKNNVLFQITSAKWQNAIPPAQFVKAERAAFVCMPSLTPSGEVDAVLRNLPDAVPVVVVKLSNAIASPFKIKLKDIFFRPERKPSDSLRQPWLISSLRRSLMKNEDEIAALLKQRQNSWMAESIEIENGR